MEPLLQGWTYIWDLGGASMLACGSVEKKNPPLYIWSTARDMRERGRALGERERESCPRRERTKRTCVQVAIGISVE